MRSSLGKTSILAITICGGTRTGGEGSGEITVPVNWGQEIYEENKSLRIYIPRGGCYEPDLILGKV